MKRAGGTVPTGATPLPSPSAAGPDADRASAPYAGQASPDQAISQNASS
jgi:hypothetical protein